MALYWFSEAYGDGSQHATEDPSPSEAQEKAEAQWRQELMSCNQARAGSKVMQGRNIQGTTRAEQRKSRVPPRLNIIAKIEDSLKTKSGELEALRELHKQACTFEFRQWTPAD